MAAFSLDLLAQLPEAYQAFGPLIDILPPDHSSVFPVVSLRLASIRRLPLKLQRWRSPLRSPRRNTIHAN